MAADPAPPSPDEIAALFETAIDGADQTFQLCLVLGGSGAAGSYTAGVVDFLIEALDTWSQARADKRPEAPPHRALLRGIVGSSGGGVTAAIAARALAFDYPTVTNTSPMGDGLSGNPFYDVWVNTFTLEAMLETETVPGDIVSLLSSRASDHAATLMETFSRPKRRRPYIVDPFRVIMTLTNLRGIPYRVGFAEGATETVIDHADYIRFAVAYSEPIDFRPRPDELVLGFDERIRSTDWNRLMRFAQATAAVPLAFPSCALIRPTSHYRYRVAVFPPRDQTSPSKVVALVPDWEALIGTQASEIPDEHRFVFVDGGLTDNEPIELGRTLLSGVTPVATQTGLVVDRAVLLIDPFAGAAKQGPSAGPSLLGGLGSVISGLVQQVQYDTSDLLLAANPAIFDRFMISPKRGDIVGSEALASSGLHAFIGFASRAFMRHDYLLGRQNCYDFLKERLVLPAENSLFKGWKAEHIGAHIIELNGEACLPIIPLISAAAVRPGIDPWPRNLLDPEDFRDGIEARYKAVVGAAAEGSVLSASLSWLAAIATKGCVADYVINLMTQSLIDADL